MPICWNSFGCRNQNQEFSSQLGCHSIFCSPRLDPVTYLITYVSAILSERHFCISKSDCIISFQFVLCLILPFLSSESRLLTRHLILTLNVQFLSHVAPLLNKDSFSPPGVAGISSWSSSDPKQMLKSFTARSKAPTNKQGLLLE